MASTSASSRGDGVSGRIRNAAATLCNDNQSLIVEARKLMSLMKEIAVDFERENESQTVKELQDASIQLVEAYGDCMLHSSAIESIGNSYQPGTELTNFEKLLNDEFAKRKRSSKSAPEKDPLIRQFREAVWNVHHAGELLPGEEQEDIVMTSTHGNVLNTICPVSGKSIFDLAEPVRSEECRHIYDKNAIKAYMKNRNVRCPIAGCPRILQPSKVGFDPFLRIEIDELKSTTRETGRSEVIEDFTAFDEEES